MQFQTHLYIGKPDNDGITDRLNHAFIRYNARVANSATVEYDFSKKMCVCNCWYPMVVLFGVGCTHHTKSAIVRFEHTLWDCVFRSQD